MYLLYVPTLKHYNNVHNRITSWILHDNHWVHLHIFVVKRFASSSEGKLNILFHILLRLKIKYTYLSAYFSNCYGIQRQLVQLVLVRLKFFFLIYKI